MSTLAYPVGKASTIRCVTSGMYHSLLGVTESMPSSQLGMLQSLLLELSLARALFLAQSTTKQFPWAGVSWWHSDFHQDWRMPEAQNLEIFAVWKCIALPVFAECASNFARMFRLTSTRLCLLYCLTSTFLLAFLNNKSLLHLIGSWIETSVDLILFVTNSLYCASPLLLTWNISFSIPNSTCIPELRLQRQSFSRESSNGLIYSTNFSDFKIWEGLFVWFLSFVWAYHIYARTISALVLLACTGWFKVHLRIAFSSKAKYFMPPETLASLLIVCSPPWSMAILHLYLSCPCT